MSEPALPAFFCGLSPSDALLRSRHRRRVAAAASTAALLSLGGCGWLMPASSPLSEPANTPHPSFPITPMPTGAVNLADKTTQDTERYASRIQTALTQPRPASETPTGKPPTTAPAETPSVAATPATAPGSTTQSGETEKASAGPVTSDHVAGNAAANATADGQTGSHEGITAMGAMTAAHPTVDAAKAGDAEPSMDAVLELLRKRAQERPGQLSYALALQLLESAETGKAADAAALSGLTAVDQKLVQELAGAIQALSATPATPNDTLAQRAGPLVDASRQWATDADLQLPKLLLASRVDSFGVYTPVESKFEYGKRHVVIIYCEVANFASKKSDDGLFTTRLAQQDTLITEDGLLVWRPNPENVEDRSRNQRHDFYLVKKLTLPETLATGKYTLRMSVTDQLTNKISMTTLPIEIVTPGVAAAGVR